MPYSKIKRIIIIRLKGRYRLILRIHNRIMMNNFYKWLDSYKQAALKANMSPSEFNMIVDYRKRELIKKLLY